MDETDFWILPYDEDRTVFVCPVCDMRWEIGTRKHEIADFRHCPFCGSRLRDPGRNGQDGR